MQEIENSLDGWLGIAKVKVRSEGPFLQRVTDAQIVHDFEPRQELAESDHTDWMQSHRQGFGSLLAAMATFISLGMEK